MYCKPLIFKFCEVVPLSEPSRPSFVFQFVSACQPPTCDSESLTSHLGSVTPPRLVLSSRSPPSLLPFLSSLSESRSSWVLSPSITVSRWCTITPHTSTFTRTCTHYKAATSSKRRRYPAPHRAACLRGQTTAVPRPRRSSTRQLGFPRVAAPALFDAYCLRRVMFYFYF